MKHLQLFYLIVFISIYAFSNAVFGQCIDSVAVHYKITLGEAHIGSAEIDFKLLESYGAVPMNVKQFYLDARAIFSTKNIDFTDEPIVNVAIKNNMTLMGGPILGDLNEDKISMWFRPSCTAPIKVKVAKTDWTEKKEYILKPDLAGKDHHFVLNNLDADTKYRYSVIINDSIVASGNFSTVSSQNADQVRIAFGSCFHKIGLHNPNLINTIVKREPHTMLLLGDIAVDDRENNFSMHRADYLLRDVSPAWQKLAANVPVYASWDDHDYLNNDLSGVPHRFYEKDREELRAIWQQNWNNPENEAEGIYFNTRIGKVEIIMLDTRSCRVNEERGQYTSYLGEEQQKWLLETLKNSTATFKIISSGTMWSDDISNGKDSWGKWDTLAREEIFNFIEINNISGVILLSGDRHGARGLLIPRSSGYEFYEFEAATLGGVPGPPGMAIDSSNQLFGHHGKGLNAFGEFTFNITKNEPNVIFRLINEHGKELENIILPFSELSPINH